MTTPVSPTKTRVAFVGVGKMGQAAHLRNYATLPDCEVVALAEIRPELGRRVAERHGVHAAYTDVESMLAKERIDALVVAQPFQRHGEILPELLARGLPIFIEKPLARSVAMAERLAAADQAAGGRLMVGYHKRSDPATVRAKAEIDAWKSSGEMGALRYIRVTMPPGDWVSGGRDILLHSDEPVGALPLDPLDLPEEAAREYERFVNYYIHQVNLIRHLLGERYEVVYADPSKILMIGRGVSGTTVTLEMEPYRTTRSWHEGALVAFEKGFVRLTLPAPLVVNQPGRVEIFRDRDPNTESGSFFPEFWSEHAMRAQARNFLRFARGETGPTCGAAEALEDMRVARTWLKLSGGE